MNTLRNRQFPETVASDPRNRFKKDEEKHPASAERTRYPEPEIETEQSQQNTPSGESRTPITNQDEQRKATNVDDNNNPKDEGAV